MIAPKRPPVLAVIALVIAAAVAVGCRAKTQAPKQAVSEAAIAPELEPYLAGGTAVVEVDLALQSFEEQIQGRNRSMQAILVPHISVIDESYQRLVEGNLRPTGKSMVAVQRKYPELFRMQDCGASHRCSFRRLAPGRWLLSAVFWTVKNPGSLFAEERSCWIFSIPLELAPGETRKMKLVRGEETVFRAEGGCVDKS